jgi:signal transduction histidine kinase
MPLFARRTLLWKYAAYFAGLVSLLLVASGAISGYFAYQESLAALEAVQKATANYAAREIEIFMRGAERAILASVAKFESSPERPNESDLHLEFLSILRQHPEISELRWISAGGQELIRESRFGLNQSTRGRDWSDDPVFKGAQASQAYVGTVHFVDKVEPYVSMAVARNTHGSVVQAEVSLRHIWELIAQAHPRSGGVSYVVDRSGQLISHPNVGLVLAKPKLTDLPHVRYALDQGVEAHELSVRARNIKGDSVVSFAVPIPTLGWTIFAEQSLQEAFRPVYAAIARSIALVVFGITAAVTISMLLARRMVDPIRAIERGAQQLGEGKFDQRIDVHSGGDELEALAGQFNRMAGKLQDMNSMQEARIAERTHDLALASDAKTRFLAAASHDLRQPMHALALFVGQLRDVALTPEAAALAQSIERSVDALGNLLEALLDLSTLDVGAVRPKPCALALGEILSRLATQFAPVASAKGLMLKQVPTSLWARSDPLLLERILINLVANSLRYTDRGRILIGCRRRADLVEVVVADTGIGISADHLPHVFQEFYRVNPVDRHDTGGLGLGLATVKRLVDLLGHAIAIESTPGKGTLVRIRLPRTEPHELAPALAWEQVGNTLLDALPNKHVLVIDDDPSARNAMEGLLERWKCNVRSASNGAEAQASARARRPDVVLCDLNLADGENGVEVAQQLQRECGERRLKCVLLTGEGPDVVAAARSMGYPVIQKPTSAGKLRALLEHLLQPQSD